MVFFVLYIQHHSFASSGSMDVKNADIDTEQMKESLAAILPNIANLTKYINTEIIRTMNLINLCLTTYFQFHGQIYQQNTLRTHNRDYNAESRYYSSPTDTTKSMDQKCRQHFYLNKKEELNH